MKTRRLCCRCGNPVIKETKVKQYPFYCPTCDENMFRFETERIKGDRKMKDEEMAEEYADRTRIVDENTRAGTDCISLVQDYEGNYIDIHERIKQAFLAGLKAGRPQWHDLRKDKNDLPKDTVSVLISRGSPRTDRARYNGKWYGYYSDDEIEGVIAWCEIPTFDKE